jgi:hypothetical protein
VNGHCGLQLKGEMSHTLHFTVPKRPAIYMPKYRKLTHLTCQYAETSCTPHAKMQKNYAIYVLKCRNVLQSTCQNAEKSCNLHAKIPKRPTLYMPQRRNALIFKSWISFPIHLKQEFLSNRTHCLPTTKTTLLIFLGPIVSVYFKKHKKHTNKLCGQTNIQTNCVGKVQVV